MLQNNANAKGSHTYIDLGGAKIVKSPTRKIKGGGDIKGETKILWGAMNHNDVMTIPAGDGGPKNPPSKIGML